MKKKLEGRLEALEARRAACLSEEIDPLSESLREFENFLETVGDPATTAEEMGLTPEQFESMRFYYRRYRKSIFNP